MRSPRIGRFSIKLRFTRPLALLHIFLIFQKQGRQVLTTFIRAAFPHFLSPSFLKFASSATLIFL